MEKLYTSKGFLKIGGRILLILTSVSAPGHKLQKPSKEFGIFQSLGTVNFVVFTKRQSEKGGPWPNAPPLNTLLAQPLQRVRANNTAAVV